MDKIERLANRLDELSKAVTEGRDAVQREFTMRVPAEPERDADIVLMDAATELVQQQSKLDTLVIERDYWKGATASALEQKKGLTLRLEHCLELAKLVRVTHGTDMWNPDTLFLMAGDCLPASDVEDQIAGLGSHESRPTEQDSAEAPTTVEARAVESQCPTQRVPEKAGP